jgi:integrase
VTLPHARESEETYAYNLEEELAMMGILELREKTAVAIASFAGLSKSEMQGLRWEDRHGKDFGIRRSVWSGIKKGTKTRYRKFPVPIIEPLAEVLDEYWKACSRPIEGWLFPNERGELPMDFNNLYRRNIMDRLDEASIDWHGWHAFRRGLASNLSELGVPDPCNPEGPAPRRSRYHSAFVPQDPYQRSE